MKLWWKYFLAYFRLSESSTTIRTIRRDCRGIFTGCDANVAARNSTYDPKTFR